MKKMTREEARDVARRLYTEYGTPCQIDTLKVRRNGETFERGLFASEADTWAIFGFGYDRILFPIEFRGKRAYTGMRAGTDAQGVCDRCDTLKAPKESRHADCYCTTHCGSRYCEVPRPGDGL